MEQGLPFGTDNSRKMPDIVPDVLRSNMDKDIP
jgi:hypothetical protein